MKLAVVALGGWLYSIEKWLSPTIPHLHAGPWGFTRLWCLQAAKQIRRPTVLIGFSEGANGAMMIAQHSPMVVRVIAHSCQDMGFEYNLNCRYDLFNTEQDTTPTRMGTQRVYENAPPHLATLTTLQYEAFERPTLFERRVLMPKRHIFHNLVPRLDNLLCHPATSNLTR